MFFMLLGVVFLSSGAFGIEYEDYFGKHQLPQIPKKVIYLSAHIEAPAMLEVWDKVVGISDYALRDDLVRRTAPLDKIEKFPTDHYAAIDVERLKKMGVDLVITYPANLQAIEFAQRFGIHFLALRTESIKALFQDLRTQAKIFGKEELAEKKIAMMQGTLDMIQKRLAGVKKEKRVVEMFLRPNHVSGKNGMDSSILASAKVDNIGNKYVSQPRGEINIENIVRENPDVIFLWWLSPYSPQDIMKIPQLKNVSAIKNKQVFKLPNIDITGPRTPLISLFVAMHAYPKYFSDINYTKYVQDYEKKMFHINP
ncbi:ABC transporter substrate-binding protein [Helicobacter mustelae]|nr:ABC transporter substrate-binding protein [Helicobacter mustelae]